MCGRTRGGQGTDERPRIEFGTKGEQVDVCRRLFSLWRVYTVGFRRPSWIVTPVVPRDWHKSRQGVLPVETVSVAKGCGASRSPLRPIRHASGPGFVGRSGTHPNDRGPLDGLVCFRSRLRAARSRQQRLEGLQTEGISPICRRSARSAPWISGMGRFPLLSQHLPSRQTLDGAVGACRDALKPPVYGPGPARYIGRKMPVCSVGLPSGSLQGSRLARTLRRLGRPHPVPSGRDPFAVSDSGRRRVLRTSRSSSLVPVGPCEEELL
jgi:hypothetical protein